MIETKEEQNKIVDFVKTQFKTFLGHEPTVFPVSSKKALKAKVGANYFFLFSLHSILNDGNFVLFDRSLLESQEKSSNLAENALWKDSQFNELETFILKTLSSEERAWLKLKNPLGH